MKKFYITTIMTAIIVLSSQFLFAQKEAWNWNFGHNAGVNFSSGSPVAVFNNASSQDEGVATMSDANGNLLFYTDGISIYNANNVIMPNGSGLLGDPSSTQSAIVTKMPGSLSQYYVFTVDYNHENTAIVGNGLRYSMVDMTLDGGLGDIVPAQKNILVRAQVYEKVTAVLHANQTDFWILINDFVDDAIYAYQLSSAGLDTVPVISNVGPLHQHTLNTLGYLKGSLQGDRLAVPLLDFNAIAVLDFDNSTGVANNRIDLTGLDIARSYGAEFSPNGHLLYATNLGIPGKLVQFNLDLGDGDTIYKYRTVLDSFNLTPGCSYYYGTVQLGPDGKMYGVLQCDSFLNVINNPDSLGYACNFVSKAVSLGGRIGMLGLPNFVTGAYVLPNGVQKTLNNETNAIVIYPNPVQNKINILSRKEKITRIDILDIEGRKIISGLPQSVQKAVLNTDALSAGVYLISVQMNSGSVVTQKFIKN